ncbi:MAG: site-specific integrase [Henriciella sp.]|nr:site-specific integrase [Henriciella sp.]
MKQKLTKRVIDSLKAKDKDYRIFDTEIPGFHVRVKPSGAKSFALKYRSAGRQRNFTIGRYGALTPDQARHKTRVLMTQIHDGGDPSEQRLQSSRELTLGEFWELYLERHAIPHKAERSVREDRSLWKNYVSSPWRLRRLSSIRRDDIQKLHSRLADRPYAANRMLCLMSKMYNLAIEWGITDRNPATSIKKFREIPRERYLTDDERSNLDSALAQETDTAAVIAIWLCILTGARKSEVLQARWSQFDLNGDRPIWTIPASNTKQAKSNRKPLSKRAVALLSNWRQVCPESPSGWLVPGKKEDKHRSDLNGPWRRVRQAAGLPDLRLHDLRHDFASSAVADGWSLEIIGRYLGHSSIQTTQRYAHLQDDPLHAMAEQIGKSYAR